MGIEKSVSVEYRNEYKAEEKLGEEDVAEWRGNGMCAARSGEYDDDKLGEEARERRGNGMCAAREGRIHLNFLMDILNNIETSEDVFLQHLSKMGARGWNWKELRELTSSHPIIFHLPRLRLRLLPLCEGEDVL